MRTGIDRTRTLRGAACGAVAAGAWALAQPLDKLAFRSGYDDVELLGKALTRGPWWYPVGFVLHISNGALFGAVYANVAPILPLPPAIRGPSLGFAEHLALWPLGSLSDRYHPARNELTRLGGNRRAWVQAGLRHIVFGVLLGELERRLNAEPEPAPPDEELLYSSNGHGPLVHAVSVEPA